MYCDCVLAKAGFQSGYIPVFLISAIFIVGALMVMVGGWRTTRFADLEKAKDQLLDLED